MKNELDGKIMIKFLGLRTKMSGMKRKLKFEDNKNYLEATQLENKINHLEKK